MVSRAKCTIVAGAVIAVFLILSAAPSVNENLCLRPLTSVEAINMEVRPTPVYGHVHLAKTSGTALNGRMAALFDNVCGHKGYSLDFAQAQRAAEKHIHNGMWNYVEPSGDVVSKAYPEYSRTRVINVVMDEIGT